MITNADDIEKKFSEIFKYQAKSDAFIRENFETKELFDKNIELIKRGVIEGYYNATAFFKESQQLVGRKKLTGQQAIDQQKRKKLENNIYTFIKRLKERVYHIDSDKKRKRVDEKDSIDNNEDDNETKKAKLIESINKDKNTMDKMKVEMDKISE